MDQAPPAASLTVVDPSMLETQIPVYDEEDLEPRLHPDCILAGLKR